MALVRVGTTDVRTTRRHGSRPVHVAGSRVNVIAYRTLCGIDRANSEWIIRRAGTLVDEDELCRLCVRRGAIARITGAGLSQANGAVQTADTGE